MRRESWKATLFLKTENFHQVQLELYVICYMIQIAVTWTIEKDQRKFLHLQTCYIRIEEIN